MQNFCISLGGTESETRTKVSRCDPYAHSGSASICRTDTVSGRGVNKHQFHSHGPYDSHRVSGCLRGELSTDQRS